MCVWVASASVPWCVCAHACVWSKDNFLKKVYLFFIIVYVCVCSCLGKCSAHGVQKRVSGFCNWSYRQVWALLCGWFGTELGVSARAVSALNCWTIFPALFQKCIIFTILLLLLIIIICMRERHTEMDGGTRRQLSWIDLMTHPDQEMAICFSFELVGYSINSWVCKVVYCQLPYMTAGWRYTALKKH